MTHDNLVINDWLNKYNNIKFDVIITDPPYPFNSQNGTNRYKDMYSLLTWSELNNITDKFYDMLNDGGRLYLFCNRDGLEPTRKILYKYNFLNLLIWDKKHFGGGYHYRNQAEFIYYVSKGNPKVYVQKISNIFSYARPTKKDDLIEINYFPSKQRSSKPINIYKDILKYGTIPGETIADPFAGSNPLRAAVLSDEFLSQNKYNIYTNTWSNNES